MNKKQVIIGSALCLIASMSWGAMFPVAQVALQKIDPFYFSFIRYAVVAALLAAILWVKEGKTAFRLEGKGKALVFYGTMAFAVYNMLIFSGQYLMGDTGTITASLIEVLMPMISILYVWITAKAKPPRYTMISMILCLVGALLVITNGKMAFFAMAGKSLFPLLLIFIAVTGWVLYSMGGSRFKDWSVLRYSTLTCLLGSLVSLIIVAFATLLGLLPVPSVETLGAIKWEMAFMITLPGIVALLSWNTGLKMLTPLNGILYINFVPITTLVIMAFQGYQVSIFEICGTLLVIFAIVRNNLVQRKEQRAPGRTASWSARSSGASPQPTVGNIRTR
ncbi:DMT family transporter [Paenibacillus lentus]|uniref:DMT family transporter n=1 Tax=Paenibacillus lentus TaxID=1338368 RepID=A0A3S8RQM3_9BACL|nr:DMT family transporter [Paenibacillus lentus]AZK45274.1 DMT family transporter [Paenibacillus lentus]